MRHLAIALTIAVAAGFGGASSASEPTVAERPLELAPLIESGLRDNPALAALRGRIDAAEHKIIQAGALPDPMFGVALSNLPVGHFELDRTPMTGIQIMLRQMYPGRGKRSLKKEMAREGVVISQTDYEEAEDEITRQIKETYHDLYFIDQAIVINVENKELLKYIAALAEIKTSVGRGPQHDLIKAQLAVTKILDKLLELQRMRRSTSAKLNALLDRPPDAPLGTPVWEGLHTYTLSAEALREVAEEDRPALVGMKRMVDMAELGVKMARLNKHPDYTAGFDYRIRGQSLMDPVQGGDFWGFSVMMNVPSWNKQPHDAEVEEAKANLTAARRDYENMATRIASAVEMSDAKLERLAGQIELFETGLIPQAELALGSARSAYAATNEALKVDMLTLLSAQLALQDLQIGHVRAVVDYEKALAELEETTGNLLY